MYGLEQDSVFPVILPVHKVSVMGEHGERNDLAEKQMMALAGLVEVHLPLRIGEPGIIKGRREHPLGNM